MTTEKIYSVDWVATFLHGFPHIDFQFAETNSTFDPASSPYEQSIVFLAALPVIFCILILLATLFCLCVHCCCKQTPTKKESTTCIRFIVALFIIFSIGSIAVGFFGNEESNKGIQSTVEALQDTNDTLRGSLITLGTLDDLATTIADAGVNTLKKIFVQHLKNATVRNDVLQLANEIKNKSRYVTNDIKNIRNSVSKISLEDVLSLTQDSEFYRWIGTIVFLCWQILVLLIYIYGTLKKSKYWIVWGITLGFFSLILAWIVAGAYLGGTVAMSDFCVNPNSFVISQLDHKISKEIITSYVECKDKRDPQNFSKALHDATFYVNEANHTLDLAINKTLKYNISSFIAGPVKLIRTDLTYAQGNITSLGNTVYCGQIHSNYVEALTGICKRSLVGLSLILVILPVLGLSLMFIQCLTPRVWLYLGTRKTYRKVDDSDPFLPRPPPYNSYGTIREERTPLAEPSYLEESATVMTSPHLRTESVGSDSPPPAYYPGSFVEQYNNMGTFPRPSSGHS